MPLNSIGGKPQNPQATCRSSPLHLTGLDGLRALAVLAVLLYHSDLGWMPAGFVGVQVFFVVSGYLITWLLLAEWHQAAQIDLSQFWLRRARRLLPALFVMIAATLSFAVAFLPEEVAGLRGDVLAALGYVTNWYLILAQESYFEAMGRPSMLQHLWSLAVEEQFYLLWPLVLALVLRWWKLRWAWLFAVVGALLSVLLMMLLYEPDIDPSRAYYGTDTRAAGLLIGAALAFLWQPGIAARSLPSLLESLATASQSPPLRQSSWAFLGFWRSRVPPHDDCCPSPLNNGGGQNRGWQRLAPSLLDAIGLVGLGILVWSSMSFDQYQPALYHWGLTLVAVTTALVIVVATHPQTRLGSFLDREPLRWIGERSYGIYLWYWPVFNLTRAQLDVPLDGVALFALRMALTVGLAALSFHFIEAPVRRGALGRAWAAVARTNGAKHQGVRLRLAGSVVALLLFSIALGASVVNAQPPPPPEYLVELPVTGSSNAHASMAATPTATQMVPPTSPSASATPTRPRMPTTVAQVAPATPVQPSPTSASRAVAAVAAATGRATQVTAIGDSVMLGAVMDLQRTIANVEVDAQTGRQVSTAIRDLRARRQTNRLGAAVVIHIGNNGPFSARQFNELMGVLAGVPRVVIVNDTVPRAWEGPNNAMLAAVVKQYPSVALIDWHALSADHPDYFWKDGIHLRPVGARVYADLINAALKGH